MTGKMHVFGEKPISCDFLKSHQIIMAREIAESKANTQ